MGPGVCAVALLKEGAKDHSSAAATASELSLTPFRTPCGRNPEKALSCRTSC